MKKFEVSDKSIIFAEDSRRAKYAVNKWGAHFKKVHILNSV